VMADILYNGFLQYIADGTIDLKNDTIKAALFASTFTPDKDTQDTWADISASEISGTNYNAGGETLANKAVTHEDAGDTGKFDADDVTYANVTLTNARYVILYHSSSGKLIGAWDLGSNQSPSATNFVVKWNAAGILTFAKT
jgi:hypothetical protein